MTLRRIRRVYSDLGRLVWEWDPLGLRSKADERQANEIVWPADEYDCVIETLVPLLQRGASEDQIVTPLSERLPEHFGMVAQPEGARAFAGSVLAWWSELPALDRDQS
jgi:hypothetical protein